jgi:hypothetical protein
MTTRTSWPLWQVEGVALHSCETLETIAEIVAVRWNAAKACYRESSFWPSTTSWTHWLCANVEANVEGIGADAYHFTRGGKLIR